MSRSFTEEEVAKFIEQAYLNGIAAAGISISRYGFISEAEDYKSSTAYREFNFMRGVTEY